MSLLFWDSFDHYATAKILYKYTSTFVQFGGQIHIGAYGRHSTNGLRLNRAGFPTYARVRRALSTSPGTVIIGASVEVSLMPNPRSMIFRLLDGVTPQASIHLENDGSLRAYRGTTTAVLGTTAPGVFTGPDVKHYIEAKIVIANAGSVEIHVDNVEVLNVSPVDTQATGSAQATQFDLGGVSNGGQYMYFDDLYVCDDSPPQCDDFLGDTRVFGGFADADAAHADFAPLVGPNNFQDIDEVSPDDNTTYNASATPTDRDSFTFDDLPGGIAGNIHAVCAVVCSRKDDAGVRTLEPSVRVGGTDYDGTPVNITTSYIFHNMYAWELNPDIAAAWTVATVNALEAGYELVA